MPISHRCTELEGRKWKKFIYLSINDKRCIPFIIDRFYLTV